jgi:hypothetical protein
VRVKSCRARGEIRMREFGISPPRLLLLKVEPEVRVRVHIVTRRETSTQ